MGPRAPRGFESHPRRSKTHKVFFLSELRAGSSGGRTSGLHPEGRRFESAPAHLRKMAFLVVILLLPLVQPLALALPPRSFQPPPDVWLTYHDYGNLTAELRTLNQTHPDLLRVFSIGKSVEGRDLWLCEITNRSITTTKRALWIDGGMHGDEVIGVECALHMVHFFLEKTSNDTVKRMLQEAVIYVLCMVNPDGVERAKNATYYADARKNAHGVDLNRNFAWYWEKGDDDPSSPVFRGPAPFSEPETRAIRNFVLNLTDQLVFYMNYHSGTEAVIHPWGYPPEDGILPEESMYRSFWEYVADWGYDYGDTSQTVGYYAPGTALDWFYANYTAEASWVNGTWLSPISFAFEVYRGSEWENWWDYFNPPPELVRYYANKAGNVTLYLMERALEWSNVDVEVRIPSTVELCKSLTISLNINNLGRRNLTSAEAWIRVDRDVRLRTQNFTSLGTIYGKATGFSPDRATLTWEVIPLKLGTMKVEVRLSSSFDSLHLLGEVRFCFYVLVYGFDIYPPNLTILAPANHSYLNQSYVCFRWEGYDIGTEIDHYEVSLDGSPYQDVGKSTEYAQILDDGPHNFTVRAKDQADNWSNATVYVTVDTKPPALQILSPSNASVFTDPTVAFSWSGYDENGLRGYWVYLDGSLLSVTNDTSLTLSLSAGRHEFLVVTEDPAYNVRRCSVWFYVDLSPPEIIPYQPPNGSYCKELTVNWMTKDDCKVVDIQVSLDGRPWEDLGYAHRYSAEVGEGPHVLWVRAWDVANRCWEGKFVFYVDRTPPVIVVSPRGGLYEGKVVVSVSCWDALSGLLSVEIYVNGSLVPSNTFRLVGGTYVVRIKAVDMAGNSATVEYVYVVSRPRPSVPIPPPPIWPIMLVTVFVLAGAVLLRKFHKKP